MSGNLPKEYKQWIPRVSQIVEFAYPFKDEDRERFLEWLWKKWVEYVDYMEEASSWGRYVHWALEKFILTWEWNWKKYKGYVKGWIDFLNSGEYEVIATEYYVRCKNYQWTIDLIVRRKSDWKYWILDWKTYWLAKHKFWIPSLYRKPYDKLKKASLQLSLYRKAVKKWKIEFLWIIELWEDYCYYHPLDVVDDKTINTIVKEYGLNYIDNI
jgi:hypothetical protein